ncbi:MAG TPA: pitrilysin family protein [Gemmatimonadaceae bacterium]|nr:pitrilysin family protein [Gemmatimonadaceae bacterium]
MNPTHHAPTRHRLAAGVAVVATLVACTGPRVVTTPPPVPARATTTPPPVATVDLTKPPALGAPPSLTSPQISTRELSNGLKIVVLEHHELPLVDVMLQVRSGGESDPASKMGTAALVAAMLTEGTTNRTALQIADQAAYLGIQLNASSGWEQSTVSLHTPIAQLDSALALFGDVALRPSFPAPDLERVRKVRLTALQQLRDRAPAIADRAFAAAVFSEQHPYGRPLAGTEGSLASITRDEVQRFYSTFYRPNNATLLVVGDVRPDDVERRARELFGAWTRGTIPTPATNPPSATKGTTVVLVDKPGAAQTSFRVGGVGAPRSTSDYFPIQVMNTILGASYTSRLNHNLRETHGYTYGAGSGFGLRRSAGPFIASAEVVTAKTDSALLEFVKELRTIRDTVPVDELGKAKRYLQLGLPSSFETTQGIASEFLPLIAYGIPLDFFASAVQRYGAVTQADVQRVARQYVDPDKLTIVLVGDRKVIEPAIRAIKPGEIVTRDIRDVLGAPPTP